MSAKQDSTAMVEPTPWLFSRRLDLAAFGGSALVSMLVLLWGAQQGLLEGGDTPEWTWLSLILLVDVAHVYATGFRVYFDREELARRPFLYAFTPLACFVLAAAIYSEGALTFWRCMAYVAVFHFVRQQYGWVALYRARAHETDVWSWRVDAAAIYMATLYPLIYWHTVPREFSWFVNNDFLHLPAWISQVAWGIYLLAIAAYCVKSMTLWIHGNQNPGKDLVVATTVFCWYVGIVHYNSDFAFTVTNVVIHGVPYLVLVWWYMLRRSPSTNTTPPSKLKLAVTLLGTVWLLAYVEELVWNRAVWHEHDWLFGEPADVSSWQSLLVPALAVPQLTHYVLDGFIWRRRSNPEVRSLASGNAKHESS